MPAFLVGADVDGKPNVLTAAWGGIACGEPPMVSLAIRPSRHTFKGIQQNGTFSVNVPSREMAVETDYCGIVSGSKADKIAACGFTVFYGQLLNAPMIEQCPLSLECRVAQVLSLGSHALVIGEVIDTFVSEDCLSAGRPDVSLIRPLAYSPGSSIYQALGEMLAPAFKAGKVLKK
jgi:flavin reductase (DIM6/NTAB) family NADH-FMN oxidoreductase RutF